MHAFTISLTVFLPVSGGSSSSELRLNFNILKTPSQ